MVDVRRPVLRTVMSLLILTPALSIAPHELASAYDTDLDANLEQDAARLGVPVAELTGLASWYGARFHGRLTANGETYDMNVATAAHKTLPFNTVVRVVDIETGRQTVVRVNDRGPFVAGRVIDLSRAAAQELGIVAAGIAKVRIEIVADGDPPVSYYLQLGSFGERANAQRLRTRLVAAGFRAVVELASAPTGGATRPLHRVVIVELGRDEAAEIQGRLRALGFDGGLLREHRS